ncbi:ABC transporter ATP-binding protein [Pediococcus inopinatus]|mgnify:FL=1|uniref:ABC transporter ATP-binding protein n=1 Tax=Pediococcus inopinatus TaxID=114090 RepID=A0ABZ0Q2L6_9LACO|nr:ABC transporter ATP-binding protein [Pediococcus inopinatus]AVL00294.1 bacitracin ABC transporter ATP-binding protein [Pediococcus inopinatus]KRN63386.1 ABC superfamily ATP binding cassette transporter, ABC protein [Pediococcus inopinatus]WPC17955.1 ABC transporter ATP-binding protein [Pediococcus inopinatus]WPC19505.1 ABC transporter ATP-binding protein [Pediococcus inopinatus]WPC21205.1 ABC transporter ATP-binding protein [Pediococcus inopinatus]
MNQKTVIDVQHITKVYGEKNEKQYRALKDVNFKVRQGEFVGIMGASGSGKTTLLNILATMDKPTEGQVLVSGQDVTKLDRNQISDFRVKQIGFIFQDFNLLESLSNAENIGLPLTLQGVKKRKANELVHQVASQLGINDLLDKYPVEISGGQKQRVAAARGLISRPQILFADEPTGALDSKNARELLETLKQVNDEEQVSVLMVTHDPFSASYCERILFIKDGKIGEEIEVGDQKRSEFYQTILNKLGTFDDQEEGTDVI